MALPHLGGAELVDPLLERVDLPEDRVEQVEVAVDDVVDEAVDELADRAVGLVGRFDRGHVEGGAARAGLPHGHEAVTRRDHADLERLGNAVDGDERDEHAEDVRAVIFEQRPRLVAARRSKKVLQDVGIGAGREHGIDLGSGGVDEVDPARAHSARG